MNTSEPADTCTALDPATPNLSSYIVLIRQGTCTFNTKVANVLAFGAKMVLFYSNADGPPVAPKSNSPDIPARMVDNVQGAQWIAALSSGELVKIKLTDYFNSSPFLEYWPCHRP